MTPDNLAPEIRRLLHRLGVTENYTGFPYTVCAVQLSIDDPGRLRLITKLIYPDVARQCCTTWQRVERNIRTVSAAAWANNRPLLNQLAARPLTRKPNNSCFLAILAVACAEGGY